MDKTTTLNTTSLKCCLTTDAIDRKNSHMHMEVQGRLMQACFIEIHQVFAKQNKVGYFSNRVVQYIYIHKGGTRPISLILSLCLMT